MDLDITAALQSAWDKVGLWIEDLVLSLPNLLAALVVLLLFWGLARLARGLLKRVLGRFTRSPDVTRVIAGMAYLGMLLVGLFLALGVLNLDKTVTSLLAGAGIIGLALGFAFQDIAENFISGIVLAVREQFHEGDIIGSNDFMGVVEQVQMRATVVRTFQGQRVLIPNAEVFKNPLVNYSQLGKRRVDVAVGVSYGDDLEEARRIATESVEGLPQRDPSRPVQVFYEEFGDSSINFQLRFWVDFAQQTDFLDARSEAIIAIKKAFDGAGITIPFPIRTLDFSDAGTDRLRGELTAAGTRENGGGR